MTTATASIHPTAVVDASAVLGEGVTVGPYTNIGANVEIGARTVIGPHVVIEDHSIVGEECHISPFSVLGGAPQDLSYKNEPTRVRIGNRTRIRESVTVNRSTGEGTETVVGDDCFLMAYAHVAHNCVVGNNVILANVVQLGGHVHIGDYAFIGGANVIHQFCRVGRYAMMGGASSARQDLPPFSMSDGRPCNVLGLNTVGLKRRGFTLAERSRLKKAFTTLWFSDLNQTQGVQLIQETFQSDPYVDELVEFILTSKRGISHHKNVTTRANRETQAENAAATLTV